MAALTEGAEAADKPDQTRDRLSLGQLMILIAGAAIGLGLLPLGAASHLPVFGPNGVSWQGLVIALYGTISGVTMTAFVLLVANRLRIRRAWGPAAVCLFASGITAWLFLPMVAVSWIHASGAFEPFSLFLRINLAHNPGTYALEAFYFRWPVACLALFVGCSLSRQAPKWWAFQGWWAEWLGMWVLAAWSVPSLPIIVGFFKTYFR
jgi:hypothetical protein